MQRSLPPQHLPDSDRDGQPTFVVRAALGSHHLDFCQVVYTRFDWAFLRN
ncbi:MAG: hypothetical protein AAF399_15880 [Bacteroidota bacterium]